MKRGAGTDNNVQNVSKFQDLRFFIEKQIELSKLIYRHLLMSQQKKRILLGVTGSIAAYKACDIVRELYRRQIDVKVVMTAEADKFVSSLTFEALSQNRVAKDLFSCVPYGPVPHCFLAEDIDLMLVAPATANIIAKFANGLGDDLLSTIFLATKAPIIIAPAMNPNMYSNPSVTENIERLKQRGIIIVDPIEAEVACGQRGIGHLAPVETICDISEYLVNRQHSLKGQFFLITAGPTREFIDPIRFISNKSSGKMGYEIARAAKARGADVTLISGPTTLLPPYGVKFIPVTTAQEMFFETERHFFKADIIILSAAVADYRPTEVKGTKIKKSSGPEVISLEKTTDILASIGEKKGKDQVLIGFAAEDTDILNNAKRKLREKNLDLIVVNDINIPGSGFEVESIQVTILKASGEKIELPLMQKRYAADRLLDEVENTFKNKR